MPLGVPPEPPQPRRGLDYLTAVFRSATVEHHQSVFDFARDLVDVAVPATGWEERPRPPFFEHAFASTTGARIETTPPDGGEGKNAGFLSLSLPGAFFYLQSDESLATSLYRLVSRDGFYRFSRVDFMVTELDPQWTAERVCNAVRRREVWAAGHRTVREFSERDFSGSALNGVTLYWGSVRSDRQGRTYDKGTQLGWPVPAIRDEVQLRGPWAHTYGRELVRTVMDNPTTAAMTQAVDQLGVNALDQHLQYWNTNGADPVSDKNWKRKASPADWYRERLKLPGTPLKREAPEPLGDEEAFQHGLRTYGRIYGRTLLRRMNENPLGRQAGTQRFLGEILATLKPEDWEPHLAAQPEAEQQRLRQELGQMLDALAVEAEHREGR